LLSVSVQVIAWRTVFEMTCNVLSGTLNLTYSLTVHRGSTQFYVEIMTFVPLLLCTVNHLAS